MHVYIVYILPSAILINIQCTNNYSEGYVYISNTKLSNSIYWPYKKQPIGVSQAIVLINVNKTIIC